MIAFYFKYKEWLIFFIGVILLIIGIIQKSNGFLQGLGSGMLVGFVLLMLTKLIEKNETSTK